MQRHIVRLIRDPKIREHPSFRRQLRQDRVTDRLSDRMKDRYDLLGSLPDTIEDEWIDNIETLEEKLKDFTRRKKNTADVFVLRYGDFLETNGAEWKFCEKVLDKDEAQRILNNGW